MAKQDKTSYRDFDGIRNDEDSKQVPPNFFYGIKNYNFGDIGVSDLETILVPERVLQFDTADIDGEFEYRFRDENDILRTEHIIATGGTLRKTDLISTDTSLKTGLSTGLISSVVFNDELYIANGKDYVQVYNGNKGIVYEMGAPIAEESVTGGNPNGTYYYTMTYVTAGGEEIIGSVSNTITVLNKQITLTLPLGYSGTLTRNIYRTATGGTQLKLLVAVANNTTLTYTDNIADASLGANISPVNNELPKPYHLTVLAQRVYGTKVDIYPTQVFATDTNIAVFDTGSGQDIAGYGTDNTPTVGIGVDFGKVIVGTGKQIYLLDPSTDGVATTRANVGMKSGYSVVSVPANGEFRGGLMFVSTLNDVRVMRGLEAVPVATSFDNISTDNWAQFIRGDLANELKVLNNIYAVFHNYRYTLVVNSTKFVFDIRKQGWTEHEIMTDNYTSTPLVLSVMNDLLYNGQTGGWVEREYASVQYRGEDVEKVLETPHLAVSEMYKVIEYMQMWFIPTQTNSITLDIVTDDNQKFGESLTFCVDGGVYDNINFSEAFYDVDFAGMDYRTININKTCRWFKWTMTVTKGMMTFAGYTLAGQFIKNKESVQGD